MFSNMEGKYLLSAQIYQLLIVADEIFKFPCSAFWYENLLELSSSKIMRKKYVIFNSNIH